MEGLQIAKLAELFKPQDEDSDSDEDIMKTAPTAKMGPGDLAPKSKSLSSEKKKIVEKKETKDIWDEDEVKEGAEYDDIYDHRPQPEYDIIYKQAVTSEDMFLQMGNKTPATASCEDMVVKIVLPDTKIADVKLDVKQKFLDCRTPKYKLGLHLPHPVDHKNGKAQWNGNQSTLNVTLRMTREYDFVNF